MGFSDLSRRYEELDKKRGPLTTLWLYREALAQAGAVEELSAAFAGHLRYQAFLATGGQIVDGARRPWPKAA